MRTKSNILQWNINSYKTKFSELKKLMKETHPICVCLQETRINTPNPFPPSQYSIISSIPNPNNNHDRGTAILVHKTVKYEQVQLQTTLQAVAVTLHIGKQYTICSLYLPHSVITRQEIENLIRQLHKPFLILGDFNAKSPIWGETRSDNRGKMIENVILNNNVSVLNNGRPTHYHIQNNSHSVIDLSICSSDCFLDFNYRVLSDLHDSDHYPVIIEVNQAINTYERTKSLNFSKGSWSQYEQLTTINPDTFQYHNIDQYASDITELLVTAAEISFERKSGKLGRPPVPWWTAECDNVNRERTRAERAMKKRPTVANKIRYKRARAICRQVFNRSRRYSWKGFVSSINSRTNINSVWNKVKKISGKFNYNASPILEGENNETINDPKEVANRFAEYFANVTDYIEQNPRFNRYKLINQRSIINMEGEGGEYNKEITEKELNYAIQSTTRTSPGFDEITYQMIKSSHKSARILLLKLYNKIFRDRVYPRAWNIAIVIPFLKKGKDPLQPDSYRPISLTSCLSKIMKKIINVRLMWYLEQNKIICKFQSGYRRNRSSVDNVVQIETKIRQTIAAKEHMIAIFFDIKKAYDTVWPRNILNKLQSYNLRGNMMFYLQQFLSNRQVKARVNGTLSDAKIMPMGIPQGSVLSCTCFIIAINDITHNLPPSIGKSLYVDDFALYATGSRIAAVERQMQLCLNHIQTWTDRTGFQFSMLKTVTMHICRIRGCTKASPRLTLNGNTIKHVNEVRYLGMVIDDGLVWHKHIRQLKTSCTKKLNLMKHLSNTKFGADRVTLLKLYTSLIRTKLQYGCEAYASASRTLMQSLQPVQNAAIRIATGAYKTSPVLSLHADSGIIPLQNSIENKIINYLLRLRSTKDSPVLAEIEVNNTDTYDQNERLARPFSVRAQDIINKYQLELRNVAEETILQKPPWTLNINICTQLFNIKKKENPDRLKFAFLEHKEDHRNSAAIFTDGSKTDNGTAYAIVNNNNTIAKEIGNINSIYSAELYAIMKAMIVADNCQERNITIYSDSRSSMQGLTKYINRHPIIQKIHDKISSSIKKYNFCWVPSHLGIGGNEKADRAARGVINGTEVENVQITRDDMKMYIWKKIRARWKMEWTSVRNNKLREIKETTAATKTSSSACRSWEVQLARLRLGHCKFSHQYLLEGDHQPYCNSCIVPLTVKHVLLECPDYQLERQVMCAGAHSVTLLGILGEQGPVELEGRLQTYLRDIYYLDKI